MKTSNDVRDYLRYLKKKSSECFGMILSRHRYMKIVKYKIIMLINPFVSYISLCLKIRRSHMQRAAFYIP